MFRCGVDKVIAFPFPFPINCKQHYNCLASRARSYGYHRMGRIEKSMFVLSPPAKYTFHVLIFIFFLRCRKGNYSTSWDTLAFGEDVREFYFACMFITSDSSLLRSNLILATAIKEDFFYLVLLRSIPTTKIKINFWFLTLLGGEHKNIMYVYVLAWPWFLFFSYFFCIFLKHGYLFMLRCYFYSSNSDFVDNLFMISGPSAALSEYI